MTLIIRKNSGGPSQSGHETEDKVDSAIVINVRKKEKPQLNPTPLISDIYVRATAIIIKGRIYESKKTNKK